MFCERMDSTHKSYKKEIISSTALSSFVNNTKKLLNEIEEQKEQFEQHIDRDVGPTRTEEYYSLIDTSVKDQDALDLLQLRRLLRDQINEAQEKIQEDVKKQFLKDNVVNKHHSELNANDETDNRNFINAGAGLFSASSLVLKSRTTTYQHSKLPVDGIKKDNFSRTTKSNISVKGDPQTAVKKPLLQNKASAKNVSRTATTNKETVVSSPKKCILLGPPGQITKRKSGGTALNSCVSQDKTKGSVLFSKRFVERIQEVFPKKPHKTFGPVVDGDKYYPCAVPLGPPNRSKVNEHINFKETEDSSALKENSPAVVKPDEEPFILSLPESSSQDVNSTNANFKEPTHSLTVTKTEPVVIKPVKEPTTSILRKPSRNPLTIEKLQSINIMGKPTEKVSVKSCVFTFQAEDMSNKSESPEFLECGQSLDMRNVGVQSSDMQNSELRFTASQLLEIINTLNQYRAEVHANRDIDRRVIENFIMGFVRENMRNTNIARAGESNSDSKKIVKENAMTQTHKQEMLLNKVTSVATQATACLQYSDKAEQADHPKLISVVTQTDGQGNCGREIAVQTSEVSPHECCNIPCKFATELMIARTSTPINYEITLPKVSKGTDVDGLSIDSELVNISLRSVHIENKDAGTSTVLSKECQTVPEMKDAAIQYEVQEMVCRSTMTTEISSRDVSIQLELERVPPEISSLNVDLGTKNAAVQSELLDLSLSSTTTVSTVTSDNDFVDDFLSEGEIQLPWNLRLLSLIERGILPKNTSQSTESSGLIGKTGEESSLSEGEVRLPHFPAIPNQSPNDTCFNCLAANSSSALTGSSDSSIMEPIAQKLICELFSDSRIDSSRSDLSEGQVANPAVLKFDSDPPSDILASEEDPLFTDNECSALEKESNIDETSLKITEKSLQENANVLKETNSQSNLSSLLHFSGQSEVKTAGESNNTKFRSFLHVTSDLNPFMSQYDASNSECVTEDENPHLGKYFSDKSEVLPRFTLPGILRSPDLNTVIEEESESQTSEKSTNSENHQLPSDYHPNPNKNGHSLKVSQDEIPDDSSTG